MDISLYKMQDLVSQICDSLGRLWYYFTTPIYQVIENLDIESSLLDELLSLGLFVAIDDLSLLELMLTTGIVIYLIYQFATWILNILT